MEDKEIKEVLFEYLHNELNFSVLRGVYTTRSIKHFDELRVLRAESSGHLTLGSWNDRFNRSYSYIIKYENNEISLYNKDQKLILKRNIAEPYSLQKIKTDVGEAILAEEMSLQKNERVPFLMVGGITFIIFVTFTIWYLI